jgi:hypothetical protein
LRDFDETTLPRAELAIVMNDLTQIQDMSAEEIWLLLRSDPCDLPPAQADSLCDFIVRIGGIENALAAAKTLRELEKNT